MEKHLKNPPDKMKCASGESGIGKNPKAFFVAEEVELLKRAFPDKEKCGLPFQHSSLKKDATVPRKFQEGELVLYRKEAEPISILSSEYEVFEREHGTNPAFKDIEALEYRDDFESDGNLGVVDAVHESDCVATAASKGQSLDSIKNNLVKQIILCHEKAEEVLLLSEMLSLRLVESESKFVGQLKKDIAGTKQSVDRVLKLLTDHPASTSQESYMEVGQHVESILEDLSRKLVEFHEQEMCDVVDDLKEDLKSIVLFDQAPVSEHSVQKEAVSLDNVFMLKMTFVAVAAVLFCLVLLLFEDPAVVGTIVEYYANATKF